MKDYHFLLIGIVLICLISWCWNKYLKRTMDNQLRVDNFASMANIIEKTIMNADRDSRFAATVMDEDIADLQKKSFCKATHRLVNDLKILWRSKFLHLFPTHHIK